MSYRRIALIAGIVVALAAAGFGITQINRKVEVTTGTRTVCTFGHTISEDIKSIEVDADKAGLYSVKTVTRVCDKHAQAQKLYDEAQEAIEQGDTEKAKAKLTQVVQLDENVGDAKNQLDAINKGKKPASDTNGAEPEPTPVTPKPEPGEGGAVALTAWAPSDIDGFSAQKPLVEAMAVTRQYYPSSSNDTVLMVVVAEQYKTGVGAERTLKSRIKDRYRHDSETLKVGGHSVYFGTDDDKFAVMAFTDGAVFVAIDLGVKPGVDPKAAKKTLAKVVEQLP